MSFEYKIEKLSARNYSTWSTVMTSLLKSKDLWDLVEDNDDEAGGEADSKAVKNEQAKHLMYVAMEPSKIAAIGVWDTAYELWAKIKQNHEGAENTFKSSSLAEFLGLKYRRGENLINFAGRFEILLGRLESAGHILDEATKLWVISNSLPPYIKTTVIMFNMANPEGTAAELLSQLRIKQR